MCSSDTEFQMVVKLQNIQRDIRLFRTELDLDYELETLYSNMHMLDLRRRWKVSNKMFGLFFVTKLLGKHAAGLDLSGIVNIYHIVHLAHTSPSWNSVGILLPRLRL